MPLFEKMPLIQGLAHRIRWQPEKMFVNHALAQRIRWQPEKMYA